MRKGREFRNKPVIDEASGKVLGYVKDVKPGQDNIRIEGLYATTLANELLFIPMENISSLGRDAVLVKDWFFSEKSDEGLNQSPNELTGAPVITLSGQSLGAIEDIVIEEKDGSIIGYEITDGHLKDLLVGRRIVSSGFVLTYGEDAVILLDNGSIKQED